MENQEMQVQQPEISQTPQPVKKTSGLGTAALVLGIIAIVLSFIPIIRVIVYVLGPLALIFGLISWIQKKSVGVAATGTIMGALAIILTILLQIATVAAVDHAVKKTFGEDETSVVSEASEEGVVSEVVTQPQTQKQMTAAELEAELAKQEVRVTSTKYVIQDETYKYLYPDALRAIVKNDSPVDIRDVELAYAAWDKNNLPVKIKTNNFTDNANYISRASGEINLVSGGTWGSDSGLKLAADCPDISKIKAIVREYTDFDGNTWENPLYEQWLEIYEGKKLS